MVLPLLGALFVAWSATDLISYFATGNDTVWHIANWFGWVDPAEVVEDTTVAAFSLTDFVISNWIFISGSLALIFIIALVLKGGKK